MGGIGREEPLQGGDAQVQARVVGRVGNAVGRGNLGQGERPELSRLASRIAVLQAIDVAGQVGPGQPGLRELAGLALGLAEMEARRQAVGAPGILLEIRLEILDRPGDVARLLAGPAHREEQASPERRALGQVAGLGEQVPGGVGIGRDHRIVGLEQPLGEGVVDLGQPVLAIVGQEALASARASSSAAARLPAASSTVASSKRSLGTHGPAGSSAIAARRVARASSFRPECRSAMPWRRPR